MEPLRIGVVGCGNISGIYLENAQRFPEIEVVAVADLEREKAEAKAERYGVSRALNPDELMVDGEVELVLNLTVPKVHYSVSRRALDAGKHVYVEKPLALVRTEGQDLVDRARAKGLRLGCAPDTFLGSGHQTCRRFIDEGGLGRVVAAEAFMLCHGHESWHPSPEFYYEAGGGPMFDMGPYYLTALVNMIGPIRRVTASAQAAFAERTITSEPKRGKVVAVETPTHLSCVMDFENGAVGTFVASFDVWAHRLPNIQVHGTEGSMIVPDPNGFGGQVWVRRMDDSDWRELPLVDGHPENARGLGVVDMARAIRFGGDHRASGDLALHILDAMSAFHEASETERHVRLGTTTTQPLPFGT